MSAAYLSLEATSVALLEMHSRFDARLGPDHPLSQGFAKLQDTAWQLVRTPGGVARSFDEFSRELRDSVLKLSQAELALVVAERREWIIQSLPLAGLRLPDLEPRQRVAKPPATDPTN